MQTGMMRLRELTLRYSVKKTLDGTAVAIGRVLSRPSDAAAALMTILQDEPAEVFGILCLSTKHHVIGYHEVSRGTIDSTLVDPRETFTAALLARAAAIIAVHVHPSGDPTPSVDDRELTRRLAAAGTLLGVSLLDHIIIGDNRYFSFNEGGLL
ncbi:MAG TPA: JAB domain-containing protein, partial [Vicinamibacterales bacterium]|jgi:DNA repair protein RadC|nr:JAB domain-containing protein [Vicinamibacterales bacterium]